MISVPALTSWLLRRRCSPIIRSNTTEARLQNHLSLRRAATTTSMGGGFAEFLGLAPAVGSPSTATPFNIFPGGASNPLNYPVTNVTLGNGQGFSSEKPAFGTPAADWVRTTAFRGTLVIPGK